MDEETENELPSVILYVSEHQRTEDIIRLSDSQYINIVPCNKYEWNLVHLQLFLNSLVDFQMRDKARVYKIDNGARFVMSFVHNDEPSDIIRVNLYRPTNKITVSATAHWLKRKWTLINHNAKTNIGTKNRINVNAEFHQLGCFYNCIIIEKDSSNAILAKHHPIFYALDSFSNVYQNFVKYYCKKFPITDDTDEDIWFINEFYKTWCTSVKVDERKTEQKFFEDNEGFIEFEISKKQYGDDKKTIHRSDGEYSILSGIYISPFAQSICSDSNSQLVHGLLMDTTWKTLPYYVTSILMASVCNVGIPLGFAFGPSEDSALYRSFYDKFEEVIGVDLRRYTIESDRGSALKSIAAEVNTEHLSCHHHFLRSIKGNEFRYQVGQLVGCKCQKDFDSLLNLYSNEFAKFKDVKLDEINRALLMAGLFFNTDKDKIEINDHVLWEHISLMHRAKYRMPSTTNALESSHGHLNSLVPRRNDFYSALTRLIKFVITKTHNFQQAYKTNYNRARRKTLERCNGIYNILVTKEIEQYHTIIGNCECGENVLISRMLLIDFPCSHRIKLGEKFPEIPDNIHLILKNTFQELKVNYKIKERPSTNPIIDVNKVVNKKAAAKIKKFTPCKNLALIENSIPEVDVETETEFVSGMPLGYFSRISHGIHEFSDFKKKRSDSAGTSTSTSSCDDATE